MNFGLTVTDPERRLVMAYAPAEFREKIALLWALDERLGSIVAAARDPLLGQIRLAWWRDALCNLEAKPAPDEPLLSAVSNIIHEDDMSVGLFVTLAEGWEPLLGDPLDDNALSQFASARGGALFGLVGAVLKTDCDGLADAGAGWALTDLSFRITDRNTALRARTMARQHLDRVSGNWPKGLRPLAMLTALARHDSGSAASSRQQGSPARILRAIWAGMACR